MKLANNLVNLDNFKRQKGSWGIETRKRKGLHYSSDYFGGSVVGVGLDRYTDRILSDSDLWTVYRRCADVRACVDSIVRRVATFDWMVVPKVSPQNSEYAELQKISKHVYDFFMHPNRNGDTWQELMSAMLTDCLVFDAGVLELAYDRKGNLQELVPLRGATIAPIVDSLGRLQYYEQNIFEEGTYFSVPTKDSSEIVKFKAKQIMYLSLFKNTALPAGNPLIESLVNEVIALMRATEHAMLNLDADEVPPGILVLAGIAGKAADEAKADLQRLKGQDHKVRVMTTPDPQGVGAKWLELRRTPKDIQMHEIIEDTRRVIYRTFGVMPVEMGMTQGMPRSTATVQMDVASSHLVTPILELVQAKINAQIIPAIVKSREVANLIEFKFDRESRLSPDEQLKLANTYRNYVTQGIMTRNEIRETLGLMPIRGGDVPTVEVAGMPQALAGVIHGYQDQPVAKEEIKIEIDKVAEDLEGDSPAPLFGDEPIKSPIYLESRSEDELEDREIALPETINNVSVSVVNGRFAFDGSITDKLILSKGLTYVFHQSDKSNRGYSLNFSRSSEGTNSDGVIYSDGITFYGTPGDSGSGIEIVTDSNTPDVLHFFNEEKIGMGGIIDFSGKLVDTEDLPFNLNKQSGENRSIFGTYGVPDDPDILKEEIPEKYQMNYPLQDFPNDEQTLEELKNIINIKKEEISRDKLEFIVKADRDLVDCFVDCLKELKIYSEDLHGNINKIVKEISIPIMRLKYYFNRARPFQVAKRSGIEFSALDSVSAHTPSYPSGHSMQSCTIAYYLSSVFPEHKSLFVKVADEISESRIIAGYHFPSDIEYGKILAQYINEKVDKYV